MQAHVVYAHPCDDSYARALCDRVVGTLAGRGWQVDLCDLYAEGFDPVMRAQERRGYHSVPANTAPVQGYVDRLRAATVLIFVHPVWNFGPPAILKGYFDRVFVPGVSFRLENGRGEARHDPYPQTGGGHDLWGVVAARHAGGRPAAPGDDARLCPCGPA